MRFVFFVAVFLVFLFYSLWVELRARAWSSSPITFEVARTLYIGQYKWIQIHRRLIAPERQRVVLFANAGLFTAAAATATGRRRCRILCNRKKGGKPTPMQNAAAQCDGRHKRNAENCQLAHTRFWHTSMPVGRAHTTLPSSMAPLQLPPFALGINLTILI